MSLLFCANMPGESFKGRLPALTLHEQHRAVRLKTYVEVLTHDIGPRNIWQPPSMTTSADYIEKKMVGFGYSVKRQAFIAYDVSVNNLESEIPGRRKPDEIIILGAHYDTVAESPGANDNGSGVAVVLELANSLAVIHLARTLRIVFFANEEPPFFFTKTMGSTVYATRCCNQNETWL